MRRFLLAILLPLSIAAVPSPSADHFPPAPPDALTGTEFAAAVSSFEDYDRYAAARDLVLQGNIPSFLRKLVPVTLPRPAGVTTGPREVTVFVTPDYLAVGTDADWLSIPLDFRDAAEIAEDLGFALPTPRIVDFVHREAAVKLEPIPLPPTDQMRSMAYVLEHRKRVGAELNGRGGLVAGDKKDVVLTAKLRNRAEHVAIYGWHHPDGTYIQPLTTVHGVRYADYSHGIRLVDDTVLVDGQPLGYFAALADPVIGPYLSDEGPLSDAQALLHAALGKSPQQAQQTP
jgi:hypothetical protein